MHKIFSLSLAATIILLLLSGCNPTSLLSPTGQPTITPLLPTATITSQPTYTTLQRPDFGQLLDLISTLRSQAEQSRYYDNWQDQVTYDGLSSLDNFISADLKHHYPTDIPDSTKYLENVSDEWSDLIHLPSASIREILFGHSVLDYLNEKQVRFSNQQEQDFPFFATKAYPLEAENGEATNTSWLVEVNLKGPEIRVWLPLMMANAGNYQVIPNDLDVGLTVLDYHRDVITEIDINNDQKKDVIILESYYFAGGISQTISIYTADKGGFYLLDTVLLPKPPPYFGESNISEYEIGDHNQNGLTDIEITSPEFEPFDCSWTERIIVEFNHEKRAEQRIDDKIPSDCYLARMLHSENPAEIVSLLESARAHLPEDASTDLRAWVQLRLAMAYYAQGRDQQTQQELDKLAQFSEKGNFLRVVQEIYQEVLSPVQICQRLYALARQKEMNQDNFDSDIDLDLAHFGGYPLGITPIPDYVCPYIDIFNFRLQKQTPDDAPSPYSIFEKLGLQLYPLYHIDKDEDIWLGALGSKYPMIVFVTREDKQWKITDEYIAYFYGTLESDLQAKVLDVTGDGHPEIILSFVYNSPRRSEKKCPKNRHKFVLEILDSEYIPLVEKAFECAERSPLDSLSDKEIISLHTPTENVDPTGENRYPEWAKFQPRGSTTILKDVEALDDLLLQNTQPEQVRAQIDDLLKSLPENDAAADILRERLIYASGLSYELEGDSENALKTYLRLIDLFPESLWSKLGQIRMVPENVK